MGNRITSARRAAAAIAVLATTLAATASTRSLHPQDGPHADIRITMNDEAVRFDVTMNLAFADAIAPTDREMLDDLPEVEAPLVEAALTEYFRTRNRVTIDGVEVTPRLDGFAVLRPGIELLPLFPRTGMRGLMRVGFDLWYPVAAPPRQIAIVWGVFPPDIVTQGDEPGAPPPLVVQAQLLAEGRLDVISFSADEPEHIWHATGLTIEDRFEPVPTTPAPRATRALPALSLGLLVVAALGLAGCLVPGARRGALVAITLLFVVAAGLGARTFRIEIDDPFVRSTGLPSAAEALEIFRPLHANIYRAFDYTAESEVYDALGRSVDGRLLDRLYDEVYRSLIMYEEGGAVSRVKAVMPLAASAQAIGHRDTGDGGTTPGFDVRARWQVEGQVYHWGHAHTRVNEYEADYTVLATPAGWRIAASRVREQIRVDTPAEEERTRFVLPPGTEL